MTAKLNFQELSTLNFGTHRIYDTKTAKMAANNVGKCLMVWPINNKKSQQQSKQF